MLAYIVQTRPFHPPQFTQPKNEKEPKLINSDITVYVTL